MDKKGIDFLKGLSQIPVSTISTYFFKVELNHTLPGCLPEYARTHRKEESKKIYVFSMQALVFIAIILLDKKHSPIIKKN